DPVARAGLVVVLERRTALEGRVLGRGGQPVATFTVVAGPGRLPPSWDCSRRTVQDQDGRFSLGVDRSGLTWIGVRAEGHAVWEDSVHVEPGGKPLTVRLLPGAPVSGKLVIPDVANRQVRATLIPRRDKTDEWGLGATRPAQEIATLVT